MSDKVIVIRKTTGADILCIYNSESETSFKIKNPYYVKYDVEYGNVNMIPFCAFTDEIDFQIRKDVIEFVVPASKDIADKFLIMLHGETSDMHQLINSMLEEDKDLDRLEAAILNKTYIEGNTTKH